MGNLCVKIVESGLASAGLPCSWDEVVIQCRFTRRLVRDEVLNDAALSSKLAATNGADSLLFSPRCWD